MRYFAINPEIGRKEIFGKSYYRNFILKYCCGIDGLFLAKTNHLPKYDFQTEIV